MDSAILEIHKDLLQKVKQINENISKSFNERNYDLYDSLKTELYINTGAMITTIEFLINHIENTKKD